MLHPFLDNVFKILQVVLTLFLFIVSSLVTTHVASAAEDMNKIVSAVSTVKGTQTEIRLKGLQPFVSSVYQLPKPDRVIVDVADAVTAEDFIIPADLPYRVGMTKVPGAKPVITRFEFFVPGLVSFSSKQEGPETLLVLETKEPPSLPPGNSPPGAASGTPQFTGVKIEKSKQHTTIQLGFDRKVENIQKQTTAKNPQENPQLILDIDQVAVDDQLLTTKTLNAAVSEVKVARRGGGLRISLTSASDTLFPYTLSENDNGVEIVVGEGEVKDQVSTIIGQHRNIESQLPEIKPLEAKLSPQGREQQMQDAFNFSGYNKERISVEFQKMDLHNVFNFLRQVSGVNIVVDESVEGSLTLVLDDVPWDFALDIILNLKGLEKEDRFNTLVIYPKGKEFKWPEQAQNNLSFKADSAVIEKEALVIQQQERQSEGTVEAKEFISKGIQAEKREDFEKAVSFYELGLEKWPQNVRLGNKISAIYLVRLQQNAKALYFAKRTLMVAPKDQVALLHAGIACANMQDTAQADQYFSRSVQTVKPSQEALMNYAAFKEDRKSYTEAMSLLSQHDQLYGKSLDSMVASARITDKMGSSHQADTLYQSILNSGFQVPPDLKKYIQGRVSLKSNL